ncbi:MAG TPA: hypothetical protein VIY27_14155 [Myxococcota bacterium]
MSAKRRRIEIIALGLALAALGVSSSAQAEDAALMGRVTAVDGSATAQLPGQAPRALGCGDPVFADDLLNTAAGAQLAVMLDDVLAQLPANSALRLGRTANLTPDVRLESGSVRIIDPRAAGDVSYLAVLDARAELMGNDVEAYIFTEKVGPYAMLCEWDAPLRVARGDERELAEPGDCVIAKNREPLYVAQAHEDRIPALAAQVCEIDPGALAALAGDPARHLTPAAVAAAGPMVGVTSAGFGESNPSPLELVAPSPCDSPGSGCSVTVPISGGGGGAGPFNPGP